ncbi:MAG: glycerol-3-phosphate dehydrogenase/oxidase, partial [Candidatus Omnitrophota bacterium]
MTEFSFKTRQKALQRFREEKFDFLIIGGGITGAGTARDAASRRLKVALVEKNDFAWGTSSRSSKLIHGGLRYLQNMEFGLVFEALSERAHLLKTVPHMVRPLPFFMPVYRGDSPGRALLSFGLWLYDFLSLFRTPGFHRRFSKKKFLRQVPFLKGEGLLGGFRYYDASMWDDVLAIETLRSAYLNGAVIANYTEAVAPLWENEKNDRIVGFQVRDADRPDELIDLHAKKVVVCAGPWTDQIGVKLSPRWHRWLNPSKGVHLIFDLKKIPVPGALVMGHPEDGRIAFVIPRPDYGAGIVIVGTTDGPTPLEPEGATIEPSDVEYLMDLLKRYFPTLNLTTSDIVSAYIGVRPLMGAQSSTAGSEGQTAPKV